MSSLDVAMSVEGFDKGSLSVRVYVSIRDSLIAGRFKPGQRLLIRELAETLGTSITPVREACLRLVSERGLELRSGRFVVVPELTRGRYLEIRTIRVNLEGLAAELAAKNVTPKDMTRLEQIQRTLEAAAKAADKRAVVEVNRQFHFVVYGMAKMDMLFSQIESLWVAMGPIMNVLYDEAAFAFGTGKQHTSLLKALKAGDGAAARNAVERDIIENGKPILQLIERLEG